VNDLGEEGAKLLGEIIASSPLPWLKLNLNGHFLSFSSPSENHIGDAGMKPLLDELEKKGSSLNELSLSRLLVSLFSLIENGLSQSSLDRIGQLLGEGKLDNLIALDLSCNASSSR
jgi:hypothetical protein